MAKIKCPYCNGEGIEPVMCHWNHPCHHCNGDGEIEESKVDRSKVPTKSYESYSEREK
jgi:DnaJ-class molecular chaperone